MSFAQPKMLLLLLGAPLLVALYILAQRRRRAYTMKFTNLSLLASVAPKRPGWKRHVPAAIMLLSLIALTAGFARPQRTVLVARDKTSIMLVIDVSRSMMANDISPDRITAAKRAAESFVKALPSRLQVGVVAFSDTAAVVAPLGTDRAATMQALDSLEPIGGTAIGDGLSAALDQIRGVRETDPAIPAAILLLSDGATNRGEPSAQAAAEAASMNVPVYTVGVGTDGAMLNIGGQLVPVALDENELRSIADATNAKYFHTTDAGALHGVYADLGSKLGYTRHTQDATTEALAIGVILLLVSAGVGLFWFQRVP
jgi:Ca-activated chloride channel family protein